MNRSRLQNHQPTGALLRSLQSTSNPADGENSHRHLSRSRIRMSVSPSVLPVSGRRTLFSKPNEAAGGGTRSLRADYQFGTSSSAMVYTHRLYVDSSYPKNYLPTSFLPQLYLIMTRPYEQKPPAKPPANRSAFKVAPIHQRPCRRREFTQAQLVSSASLLTISSTF